MTATYLHHVSEIHDLILEFLWGDDYHVHMLFMIPTLYTWSPSEYKDPAANKQAIERKQ